MIKSDSSFVGQLSAGACLQSSYSSLNFSLFAHRLISVGNICGFYSYFSSCFVYFLKV